MKDKCKIEGCDREANARGMCMKHWKRAKRRGEFEVTKPPVYEKKCVVDGCESDQEKRGYCQKHYRRMQRNGHLETVRQAPGGLVETCGYLSRRIDGVIKHEHVWIAEKALGVELPDGVEVHHVNEIRSDNRPENLVVCQDRAYHLLLHSRQKAYDACGNANWRKCVHCKQYDDPANLSITIRKRNPYGTAYHKECAARYVRERKLKLKKSNE